MKKSDVYDYLADNDLDEVRFVVTDQFGDTVVEVFFDEHFDDYMVADISDGVRTGNERRLGSFKEKVFALADDALM